MGRIALANFVVIVVLAAVPFGLWFAFKTRPRGALAHVLSAVALALAAFPLGAITAFFLWPFWGWFEARTGIESLGHSGPANWAFEVTWGLWAAGLVILYARRVRGR